MFRKYGIVEKVCWCLVLVFCVAGVAEIASLGLAVPGCAALMPGVAANEKVIADQERAISEKQKEIDALKVQPASAETQAKMDQLAKEKAEIEKQKGEVEKENLKLKLDAESNAYGTVAKVAEVGGLLVTPFLPVAGYLLSRASSVAKAA